MAQKLLIGIGIGISFVIPQLIFANSYVADLERDTQQYGSILDASQTGLDLTTSFSQSAWVKLESQPSSNEYPITAKHTGSAGNRNWRWRYVDITGTKYFCLQVGTSDNCVTLSLSTATWTHIGVAFDDPNNQAKIYKDGVESGTITGLTTTPDNSSSAMRVGADEDGGYFDGLIDDVRIYSSTIFTATDFDDQYSDPCNYNNTTNLQGYWKLENNLLDETANNNDLTNNNSLTFTTDTPYTCDEEPPGNGTTTAFASVMPTDEEMQYWITVILMIIATLLGLDLIRRMLARFQQ